MTQKFKEQIKAHEAPLFYNTTGSTEAYKLCIRHLSSSPFLGLAKLNGGFIYPNEVLYIVDLENETIEEVCEHIKLCKLEVLD